MGCGSCIWNVDGLCDMRGVLVLDDDVTCRKYEKEEKENKDDERV